jgi:hypothetical protein
MQLLDSFRNQLTSNCVMTLSTMMLMIMTFIGGCHNFIVVLNVIRLSVVILSFVEFLEPYQKCFQNSFQDHFRLTMNKGRSYMKLDAGFHILIIVLNVIMLSFIILSVEGAL